MRWAAVKQGCGSNRLLGCATSKPTGHLGPPVMHETDRRRWAALGAFAGGGADGDGARSEIVTDASLCVSVASRVCIMLMAGSKETTRH